MARSALAAAVANATLGRLGRLLNVSPLGRRTLRRCSVARDLAYHRDARGHAQADHLLDVYWPAGAPAKPLPLVVYVHGGGFGLCDKDTHGLVAAALAARGLCVANVNYRRVPGHPYPAALYDVARAIAFCVRQAPAWHAQADQLVLMGESAGANLVLAQALALASRGHGLQAAGPDWTQPLRAAGVRVRALLPLAGLLDVEEPERFDAQMPALSALVRSRIQAVCAGYAPAPFDGVTDGPRAHWPGRWASPLRVLEAAPAALPDFPPTWIGVGGSDPILHDSERLHVALLARGLSSTLRTYPDRGHAFFALPWGIGDEKFWGAAAAFIFARVNAS